MYEVKNRKQRSYITFFYYIGVLSTLREERKLRVFENMVLRRMF